MMEEIISKFYGGESEVIIFYNETAKQLYISEVAFTLFHLTNITRPMPGACLLWEEYIGVYRGVPCHVLVLAEL